MTESDLSRVGAPLRAPALSVRGLGPAEVTVAGLTAGGGALLLFRLLTFWLPVPLGWASLNFLEHRQDL